MSDFRVMPLHEIKIEAGLSDCDVIVAADNELQFDLDNEDAFTRFWRFYGNKLYNRYGRTYLPKKSWASKGGNTHIVVTLPGPLPIPERIALQTQGGSDPGREFAALCCYWDGSEHPILLYKPRAKVALSLPESTAA